MASIGKDNNGRKRILFIAPDGKRKTVRLGKATMRDAELIKQKIERIVSSQIAGNFIDDDTTRSTPGATDSNRIAGKSLSRVSATRFWRRPFGMSV